MFIGQGQFQEILFKNFKNSFIVTVKASKLFQLKLTIQQKLQSQIT